MEWIKMLAASLCILSILLHLIPEGRFVKYVRFYAGLLFFLIAAGPVLQFFSGDGVLERMLQVEFLKEEYYDMETAVSGLEELKNDQIREAYRQELHRQVQDLAAAYGLPVETTSLGFDPTDGFTIREVAVVLEQAESYDSSRIAALQKEISEVYQIGLNQIQIQ